MGVSHFTLLYEITLLQCSKLILTHLASVSVDQVEDGFILRLPSHGFVQTFSLDSAQHELQHVQLDWLLNKHNVVLRHDWRGRTHGTRCMQRTNNMTDKAYSYFIIYVIFSISYTVDLLAASWWDNTLKDPRQTCIKAGVLSLS